MSKQRNKLPFKGQVFLVLSLVAILTLLELLLQKGKLIIDKNVTVEWNGTFSKVYSWLGIDCVSARSRRGYGYLETMLYTRRSSW